MKIKVSRTLLFTVLVLLFGNVKAADWNRLSAPIMTAWGEKIDPDNVWGRISEAADGTCGLDVTERSVGIL